MSPLHVLDEAVEFRDARHKSSRLGSRRDRRDRNGCEALERDGCRRRYRDVAESEERETRHVRFSTRSCKRILRTYGQPAQVVAIDASPGAVVTAALESVAV